MESCKVIFNDKSVRRQAAVTVIILLAFILLGQLIVARMAEDYKKGMVEHDYAVAGYMSGNGVDHSRIVTAFTSAIKPARTLKQARLCCLLPGTRRVRNSLLPVVASFHQNLP